MNSSKRIKILQVIDSLGSGGAESLLKNFVLEAKKDNIFNIEIATLYSNNIFKEKIKNAGISIWDLNLKYKYDLRGILKIITVIKKGKYDIIHVHLFPAGIFAALASLFLPKDIVWIFSEHSVYNRRRSFKIFKILDSFTYSRYLTIICVSKQVQSALISWLPSVKGKTKVIPNAVPVPKLLNFSSFKTYDILFIGRLVKAKGIDILLRAINILKNRYKKKLKVAIVGEGSSRKELEDLSIELEIDEEVKFFISEGIYEDENDVELDVIESFNGVADIDELLSSEIELIKSDYHSCDECKHSN